MPADPRVCKIVHKSLPSKRKLKLDSESLCAEKSNHLIIYGYGAKDKTSLGKVYYKCLGQGPYATGRKCYVDSQDRPRRINEVVYDDATRLRLVYEAVDALDPPAIFPSTSPPRNADSPLSSPATKAQNSQGTRRGHNSKSTIRLVIFNEPNKPCFMYDALATLRDSKLSFILKTKENASVLGIKTSKKKPDFEYWDWQENKYSTYAMASLPKEFAVGEILVLRRIAEGVKGPSDFALLRDMREKSLRAAGPFPSQLSSVTGSESPGSESVDTSNRTFEHSPSPSSAQDFPVGEALVLRKVAEGVEGPSDIGLLRDMRAKSFGAAGRFPSELSSISGSETSGSKSMVKSTQTLDRLSSPPLNSPTKHLQRFTATSRNAVGGSSTGPGTHEGAHISNGKKRKASRNSQTSKPESGVIFLVYSEDEVEKKVEKTGKRRKIDGKNVIVLNSDDEFTS
ncbi:hypothetical protein BD410DRAFT_840421 [Rickenella mellea]|uniref:Uncharacterized protein n=1 Tax=Rickenella mellea TaxID=50990 RepID=A0A4Y7Q3J2_9AGAM|nr:hypothetical protein BD410DRAFT_840421 [Rickenella mellea]